MADLRKIIAENICALRTDASMTQAQLAEVLNYSDKAVSKWERGEAIPDVIVLAQLAEHFGVTVDYLLSEGGASRGTAATKREIARKRNRFTVSIISVTSVWVIATLIFVVLLALGGVAHPWLVYIYAIPASAVVALIFNSIFGRGRLNFIIVSILLWSLLLSLYLSMLLLFRIDFLIVFIVGVPAQLVIFLIPGFTSARGVRTAKREDDK